MFPKPSPVCGIYNDVTGSYVQSVPFDRIEKNEEDGTFEVSLFRRLHAKDWRKYSGHLSFRCYIIVMSTSWRKGIQHKLFGEPGCPVSPKLEGGFFNLSQSGQTCWLTPKEGSRLNYGCGSGLELTGPQSLVCKNGSWTPVPENPRHLTREGPYRTVCSSGAALELSISIAIVFLFMMQSRLPINSLHYYY